MLSPPQKTYSNEPQREVDLAPGTENPINKIIFGIYSGAGGTYYYLCQVRVYDLSNTLMADIKGTNHVNRTEHLELEPSEIIVSARVDTNGGNSPLMVYFLVFDN